MLQPGIYVVATPIGNLGDLSKRALDVLGAAEVVAAEDTRTSQKLVKLAGGHGRLTSLTEHNVHQRTPELLAAASGGIVALVSDAGTPVIADPGARLVDAAHDAGISVIAVPGPSALAAAVSVSGFSGDDAHFLGFLPRPKSERIERLRRVATAARVIVFFESPKRLSATLGELAETFGDPRVAVCRELTKLHEEVARERASVLADRFRDTRGECTVVVELPEPLNEGRHAEARAYMGEMKRAGARRSGAAAEAARRFSVSRQDAYEWWE